MMLLLCDDEEREVTVCSEITRLGVSRLRTVCGNDCSVSLKNFLCLSLRHEFSVALVLLGISSILSIFLLLFVL